MQHLFLSHEVLANPRYPSLPVGCDEKTLRVREFEWGARFGWADPHAVRVAVRLFPSTSAEAFERWLGIRSKITPEQEAAEPIMQEETGRLALMPILDPEMVAMRNTIERNHWLPDHTNLEHDALEFKAASPLDQQIIMGVLGFFSVADKLITDQLEEVVEHIIKRTEGTMYLTSQANQEWTHNHAYSRQVAEIVGAEHRERLLDSARTMRAVGLMADWMRWWTLGAHPAADVIAVLAFAEGVLFSGFFAAIQYFQTKNRFAGLTTMNEYISRDEKVHTEFWCFVLTKRLIHRPSPDTVAAIADETVRLCDALFRESMPADHEINPRSLGQYVRYTADTVLADAGYPAKFGASLPFSLMANHALNRVTKTNFFERQVTGYQAISAGGLTFDIDRSPITDE